MCWSCDGPAMIPARPSRSMRCFKRSATAQLPLPAQPSRACKSWCSLQAFVGVASLRNRNLIWPLVILPFFSQLRVYSVRPRMISILKRGAMPTNDVCLSLFVQFNWLQLAEHVLSTGLTSSGPGAAVFS